MIKILSLLSAAAILLTAGCGASVSDSAKAPDATASPAPVEINCCTDPDLSNVLNDIYKKYREKHPELSIVFCAGSPEEIQRRIEGGEECDVVFSSRSAIDTLDANGDIVSGSVTDLVENSAALICAEDSDTEITGFNDLNNAESVAVLKRGTPLGEYSRKLLDDYGVTIDTDEYDSTDEIIDAVINGDSETGIVYSTDAALAKDDVSTISDPDDDMKHTTSEYTLALVNNGAADASTQKAAESFFKYLLTNASRNSFIYYGFTMK